MGLFDLHAGVGDISRDRMMDLGGIPHGRHPFGRQPDGVQEMGEFLKVIQLFGQVR